jgi:hypothetical protein
MFCGSSELDGIVLVSFISLERLGTSLLGSYTTIRLPTLWKLRKLWKVHVLVLEEVDGQSPVDSQFAMLEGLAKLQWQLGLFLKVPKGGGC